MVSSQPNLTIDRGYDSVLSERVLRFAAEFSSVEPAQLRYEVRIAQDLGIDGDEAVAFFESFATAFEVDLRELYLNWDLYFLPEGGGQSLATMILICGCVLAGFGLSALLGVLPAWAWIVLLVAVGLFIYTRYFAEEDRSIPITISDLVDAANQKRWTKPHEGLDRYVSSR